MPCNFTRLERPYEYRFKYSYEVHRNTFLHFKYRIENYLRRKQKQTIEQNDIRISFHMLTLRMILLQIYADE